MHSWMQPSTVECSQENCCCCCGSWFLTVPWLSLTMFPTRHAATPARALASFAFVRVSIKAMPGYLFPLPAKFAPLGLFRHIGKGPVHQNWDHYLYFSSAYVASWGQGSVLFCKVLYRDIKKQSLPSNVNEKIKAWWRVGNMIQTGTRERIWVMTRWMYGSSICFLKEVIW